MIEQKLIPFNTSKLPAGPWLVFAPHADDETFGMGGSILLAHQQGIAVDVVIMTDGSLATQHQDVDIVSVREKEALEACAAMNVRDCQMWKQADRGLTESVELTQQITALINERRPKHVFVPSCMEFHPDHRSTAKIVWDCLQTIPESTPTIVSYDISNLGPCNLLIDIDSVKHQKRDVMELYKSQVSNHRYIELVESINTARTFSLGDQCTTAESFFVFNRSPGMSYEQAVKAWFTRFLLPIPVYEPLVSVVVRTKDRPAFLQKALSSLALQEHQNLEVIVVNDGGAPPSDELIPYQTSFSAFKLLSNTHSKGRSAAANQGLEQVSGEFFMFLDDDDWFEPDHIANLLGAFSDKPDLLVAYSGARAVATDRPDERVQRVFNDAFDRNRLFYENYIPIHVVMMRRSVIDAGYRMDESLEVFEDWDFWLQLCQITLSFTHVDCISANYRVDDQVGIGVLGGHDEERRQLYCRWAKTWGVDEIDDLLTRLVSVSKRLP